MYLFGDIEVWIWNYKNGVISIRARACIKCKKYVLIQPDNIVGQLIQKSFEKKHEKHNLVTLDLMEILDFYKESTEKEHDIPEIEM